VPLTRGRTCKHFTNLPLALHRNIVHGDEVQSGRGGPSFFVLPSGRLGLREGEHRRYYRGQALDESLERLSDLKVRLKTSALFSAEQLVPFLQFPMRGLT